MTTKQKTAQEWFALALQLYGQERYRQAMHAHRQVKRQDPGGFHDSMLDGMHLFLADRFEEALAAYERALALQPEVSLVHTYRGVVLMCLQRDDEALAAFEEALRRDPGNSVVLTQIGNVYLFLKRYDEALALADQVLAGKEADGALPALRVRTAALYNLGRYDEALSTAEQLIALAPGKVFGYAARADALERLGRLDEALAAFEEALYRDRGNGALWNRTGAVLLRLGRSGDALAAYERALRLEGEDLASLNGRGVALLEMGRLAKALKAFDRALLRHPGDSTLLGNREQVIQAMRVLKDQVGDGTRPRIGYACADALALLCRHRLFLASWAAGAVAAGLTLVLLFHPDLLLRPLETAAIPLYPLVCWFGWYHRHGQRFHARILRWLPLTVLPAQLFVRRPPRTEDYLLRLMRANVVGAFYLALVASLLQQCLALRGVDPDAFTALVLVGLNLLFGLHILLMVLAALFLCAWPLLGGVRRMLTRATAGADRSRGAGRERA